MDRLVTVGESAKVEGTKEFLGRLGESGGVELKVESLGIVGREMTVWSSSETIERPRGLPME